MLSLTGDVCFDCVICVTFGLIVLARFSLLITLPGVAIILVPSVFVSTLPPSGNCTDITTGVTVCWLRDLALNWVDADDVLSIKELSLT